MAKDMPLVALDAKRWAAPIASRMVPGEVRGLMDRERRARHGRWSSLASPGYRLYATESSGTVIMCVFDNDQSSDLAEVVYLWRRRKDAGTRLRRQVLKGEYWEPLNRLRSQVWYEVRKGSHRPEVTP